MHDSEGTSRRVTDCVPCSPKEGLRFATNLMGKNGNGAKNQFRLAVKTNNAIRALAPTMNALPMESP